MWVWLSLNVYVWGKGGEFFSLLLNRSLCQTLLKIALFVNTRRMVFCFTQVNLCFKVKQFFLLIWLDMASFIKFITWQRAK